MAEHSHIITRILKRTKNYKGSITKTFSQVNEFYVRANYTENRCLVKRKSQNEN